MGQWLSQLARAIEMYRLDEREDTAWLAHKLRMGRVSEQEARRYLIALEEIIPEPAPSCAGRGGTHRRYSAGYRPRHT